MSGQVGTVHFPAEHVFHDLEKGVVEEGAALHEHMFSEIFRGTQTEHFVKGVADDRVAEAGRYVVDTAPFLLRLLHLRIHEHGTAGAEISGMLREKRGLHEFFHAHAEAGGEGLQKGAASRGAGLVEAHVSHGSLVHLHALHVLAADIDDIGGVGVQGAGCLEMGNSLHLRDLGREGRARKVRAVACGAYAAQVRGSGDAAEQINEEGQQVLQGIAVVAVVGFGKHAACAVNENALDRCRAEVHAEVEIA